MKISIMPIAWYLTQIFFFQLLSRWICVHSPTLIRDELERISS